MLKAKDTNIENELRLLQMFQKRFETYSIQGCENMLRDMMESSAWNSRLIPDSAAPEFQVKILSRVYWPISKDETTFRLPGAFERRTAEYAYEFHNRKPEWHLDFLPLHGRVTLELQLEDRTFSEEVTMPQATVINQFHSESSASVSKSTSQIAQAINMDVALVKQCLNFWVGKIILAPSASDPDTFSVLESLSSPQDGGAAQETTAAAAAAAAEEAASPADMLAENAGVYATYVVAMLTNGGAMPTKRVGTMLKAMVPGGFPFETAELVGLLQSLVGRGQD